MKQLKKPNFSFKKPYSEKHKTYVLELHQLLIDHLNKTNTSLKKGLRINLLNQYKRTITHRISNTPGRFLAACSSKGKKEGMIWLDPTFFDRRVFPKHKRTQVMAHEICHLAGYDHNSKNLKETESYFNRLSSPVDLPKLVNVLILFFSFMGWGLAQNEIIDLEKFQVSKSDDFSELPIFYKPSEGKDTLWAVSEYFSQIAGMRDIDTLIKENVIIIRIPEPMLSAGIYMPSESQMTDTLFLEDSFFGKMRNMDAQDTSKRKLKTFQLITDQEAFLFKDSLNEDRDYTMGIQFRWTGEATNSLWYFLLPGIHYGIDKIPNKLRTISRKEENTSYALINHAISFGFSAFTPEDLLAVDPVFDDRPYASLLYFGTERLYTRKRDMKFSIRTNFSTGFFGGFTGTGIAKFVQSGIHSGQRATSSTPEDVRPDPLGWENQLSSSTSLFYQYDFKFFWNLTPKDQFLKKSNQFKFIANIYTGAGTGIYDFINLPSLSMLTGYTDRFFDEYLTNHFEFFSINDSLPSALVYTSAKPNCFDSKNLGIYLIANINPKLWLRNSTLQGLWWDSSENDPHRINASELKNLTLDYEFGAGIKLNKTHIGYTFNSRSPETTLNSRRHLWGRVFLKIVL